MSDLDQGNTESPDHLSVTPEIPTPWVAIVVRWGERNKHIYADMDRTPEFFRTEQEARNWGNEHCRMYQTETVVIAKIEWSAKATVDVSFYPIGETLAVSDDRSQADATEVAR